MLKIIPHEVISLCYDHLLEKHPRTPVTAKELVDHIGDHYNEVRDVEIEQVARWLYLHFGLKLAGWFEAIAGKVAKVDETYYQQLVSGDVGTFEDDIAQGAAYALAVVLFYRAIDRGDILYRFEMSEAEAAAWIQQHGTAVKGQLSLFSVMGS